MGAPLPLQEKKEEQMRIADILTEQMEEEEEEEKKIRKVIFYNKSSSSFLPSLLSRWISRRKSGPARDFPVSDRPVMEPDKVATEETSSGVEHKEDISFNIGMGIGLVFLLAKSAASEVNKMIELREHTEMLLKEVRAELRNKDAIVSSSESNNKFSISPSQCCGDASRRIISMDVCNEPYDCKGIKHTAESESQLYYETASGNTRSVSIDQMEAELEVELERLETNLEGETSSVHQCVVKLDNESDGPFESFRVNYEEDDIVPNNTQEFYGVSAFELERRLHELLATRQEEQIEELQSALECMEKKLLEKEMELRWWKETNSINNHIDTSKP